MVVGLGNWPKKYHKNRHNVGFIFLDHIAKAKFNRCMAQDNLHLLKPQTLMNLSGIEVKNKLKKTGISIKNLIVIYDDADLEIGEIRVKRKGSAGGHNGVKSIIENLGTDEFIRIRIGVGRDDRDLLDSLLSDFTEDELERLPLDQVNVVLNTIIKEETK